MKGKRKDRRRCFTNCCMVAMKGLRGASGCLFFTSCYLGANDKKYIVSIEPMLTIWVMSFCSPLVSFKWIREFLLLYRNVIR